MALLRAKNVMVKMIGKNFTNFNIGIQCYTTLFYFV